MKVINLFGGPGAGKSTTAAGLFFRMKNFGLNVELVTEYAKDLTWEDRQKLLGDDQLYVFAKQQRRLNRLKGKVDYVVTDSPLLLGLAYCKTTDPNHLPNLIKEVFDQYDNYNFFINRGNKPYQPIGRNQTSQEAQLLDKHILSTLDQEGVEFVEVDFEHADIAIWTWMKQFKEEYGF